MPTPVIAVDTNVLIDRAGDDETVIDCISTVNRKFKQPPILVLPTVIGELAFLANGSERQEKQLAQLALEKILEWEFRPINYVPVGHGIVQETARKIRDGGLVPEEEINDSLIIAEAALANVTILLSSDGHMKNIPAARLKEILDGCDVATTMIVSPWKIVKDFYNSVH